MTLNDWLEKNGFVKETSFRFVSLFRNEQTNLAVGFLRHKDGIKFYRYGVYIYPLEEVEVCPVGEIPQDKIDEMNKIVVMHMLEEGK